MRAFGIAITAAAIAVLAGCASVKESYAPDGRKAYNLNCSGTARGWDKCFAAAGEICGSKGYDVLDRSADSRFERSMQVACKS